MNRRSLLAGLAAFFGAAPLAARATPTPSINYAPAMDTQGPFIWPRVYGSFIGKPVFYQGVTEPVGYVLRTDEQRDGTVLVEMRVNGNANTMWVAAPADRELSVGMVYDPCDTLTPQNRVRKLRHV